MFNRKASYNFLRVFPNVITLTVFKHNIIETSHVQLKMATTKITKLVIELHEAIENNNLA